jgi:hypothetical protein
MTSPARGGTTLSSFVRRMAAVLLLAGCGSAAASPEQGPLGVRTPGSLRDLFLDVVQWDARAVPALRLDVGWAMANDWSTPTTLTRDGQVVQVRLDEQADSLTAALRVPWGVVLGSPEGSFLRRLTTALEIRGTVHWGGWSDPVIDAWHRVFSYNDFARPAFPSNEIHLALHPALGTAPVDIAQATFAFGDVVLRNQLLLWQGGEPLREGPEARAGVSLRLDVKIPTGSLSRMGGSGGFDLGLGLLGTWQATSWLVGHAIVTGSIWSPMTGDLPLRPRTWQGSAGLSLAVLLGGWSILLEDRWSSAPFQAGWGFVEVNPEWNLQSSAFAAVTLSQNQITGGVRYGPITFWFQEDFTIGHVPGLGPTWFHDSNAPDVALGLTLTVRP